jgi:ATP-binding cassette, subfamily C, bacterial
MRQIFKIFFNAEETRPWLVLLCLLLGGFAEAVGIGSLLPVASAVLGGSEGTPSPFESSIKQGFALLGLTPTFGNMVVLVVAIMLSRSVLLFSAMSYAGISAARVSVGLRRRLVKAFMQARWSFYANQSTGQLANSLSFEASRAGEAYNLFAAVAANTVQIFMYAVIALAINWRVALAGILAGGGIALLSSRLVAISRRAGFKQSERIGALTSDMVDVLQNIKALKSMDRYASMLDHIDVLLDRLRKSLFALNWSRFGLSYGNDAIVAILIGGGAYAAHTYGQVSLPELLVFGILFYQVISYASKLLKQLQAAAQFEGAYVRITGVLNSAIEQQEILTGTKTPDTAHGFSFDKVDFAHGERLNLKGVSIDIPANAITVLQGPSGAGKTTILDLLVGFHKPLHGTVRIGKDDLADVDIKAWRKSIGYVPQELALFHDTVRANITLYDDTLSDDALQESLQLSGVNEFLPDLANGLETDVGEHGGKLSGGQKQRISLARALITRPKVLILDEVTSALDPETESEIVSNIGRLRGKYTVVAITHRPAWTSIADHLYQIKDGKAILQKTSKRKIKT